MHWRLAIAAAGLAGPAAASPFFTSFDPGPGGWAYALSADGSTVVGRASPSRDEAAHAFRWTEDSGLVVLVSGAWSEASAVSASGDVVMGTRAAVGRTETVRWDAAGQATELAGTQDRRFAPIRISADGAAAVGSMRLSYAPATGSRSRAARWSEGAGLLDLGVLPGGDASWGYGISRDGSVVVGASEGWIDETTEGIPPGWNLAFVEGEWREVDREHHEIAFRWTEETGMEPIAWGGLAAAASADGSVITGTGCLARWDCGAFRWTAETGMVPLWDGPHLTQPDGRPVRRSTGVAVSANGDVIVGAQTIEVDCSYDNDSWDCLPLHEAFVWDPAHGMRSVADLLREKGLGDVIEGWHLWNTFGVSDDGLTIAGNAFAPDGSVRSFVAFVPEPAPAVSFLLTALGLLGLVHWVRR